MPPIQNTKSGAGNRSRTVLVLNASWEALNRVSVHRALVYLVRSSAVVVEQVPNRVIMAGGNALPVPTVVRLVRYVAVTRGRRVPNCTRRGVLARDGHRCAYCGAAGANTIDHVLPRSRGGASSWTNLVAACMACNQDKADRTPAEARMTLRVTPTAPAYLIGFTATEQERAILARAYAVG